MKDKENNSVKSRSFLRRADKTCLYILSSWLVIILMCIVFVIAVLLIFGNNESFDEFVDTINENITIAIIIALVVSIPIVLSIRKISQYYGSYLEVSDKIIVGRGKKGWFKTATFYIPLNKIDCISVSNNWVGKLFNFGEITCFSAGTSMKFVGIKNPNAFKNIILSKVDEYERLTLLQQSTEAAETAANQEFVIMKKLLVEDWKNKSKPTNK